MLLSYHHVRNYNIDPDADAEDKIYRCFQNMGVDNFFLHLESLELDLSQETSEKLKSLKTIIEIFGEERGQA